MQDLVRVPSFLIILGLLRSVVTFDIPLLLNETHVIMTRLRKGSSSPLVILALIQWRTDRPQRFEENDSAAVVTGGRCRCRGCCFSFELCYYAEEPPVPPTGIFVRR